MSEENEQTKVLKDILKWIKVSGIKDIKPVLEEQFQDDTKKKIYQLSDGSKGTQEIAKIISSVKHVTVFNYWKTWEKLGLGESITVSGGKRFLRSFNLEDFGIKVPEFVQSLEKETPQSKIQGEQHDN